MSLHLIYIFYIWIIVSVWCCKDDYVWCIKPFSLVRFRAATWGNGARRLGEFENLWELTAQPDDDDTALIRKLQMGALYTLSSYRVLASILIFVWVVIYKLVSFVLTVRQSFTVIDVRFIWGISGWFLHNKCFNHWGAYNFWCWLIGKCFGEMIKLIKDKGYFTMDVVDSAFIWGRMSFWSNNTMQWSVRYRP